MGPLTSVPVWGEDMDGSGIQSDSYFNVNLPTSHFLEQCAKRNAANPSKTCTLKSVFRFPEVYLPVDFCISFQTTLSHFQIPSVVEVSHSFLCCFHQCVCVSPFSTPLTQASSFLPFSFGGWSWEKQKET